jgi:hypothetical protein
MSAPAPEPSNADIMAKLDKIDRRLDRGDRRFTAIDRKFESLAKVSEAAETIVQVAETYKLIGLGGKVTIWIAKVLGALGVLVASIYAVKAWINGQGPNPMSGG